MMVAHFSACRLHRQAAGCEGGRSKAPDGQSRDVWRRPGEGRADRGPSVHRWDPVAAARFHARRDVVAYFRYHVPIRILFVRPRRSPRPRSPLPSKWVLPADTTATVVTFVRGSGSEPPPGPGAAVGVARATGAVYDGRANHLAARIPRFDADIDVDGTLSAPVWQQAALLNGFSEYFPVDGRPASDSTEVFVWYSATAIYFGIRAFETHGAVHATLANRDLIDGDDNVQLVLTPFVHGRHALLLAVNPFGVQEDGTITEGVLATRIQCRRHRTATGGSERGFRVRVEGTSHVVRLRGRDADPFPQLQVPAA